MHSLFSLILKKTVSQFFFSQRPVRFNDIGNSYVRKKKAIEDWPPPTIHDSGEVGVSCTFCNVPAAGIARSSQLSSSLQGQAVPVRYVMAGNAARPITVQITKLDRAPCWVVPLRPLASVALPSVGNFAKTMAKRWHVHE